MYNAIYDEDLGVNKLERSVKKIYLNEKRLSIIVFSLFFSWLLAFPFEGQLLYAITSQYNINPGIMVFGSIIAQFVGLFSSGFFVKNMKIAKYLLMYSILFCILTTCIFFFKPSILWSVFIIISSLIAGMCIGAWGFYFKEFTPCNERIKTAAGGMIYSNILMILINVVSINISVYAGLILSIFILLLALFFVVKLPEGVNAKVKQSNEIKDIKITKSLAFLCFFIITITINSGLMYQVMNPEFSHHEFLVSWYWAVPYIVALYIMGNLPKDSNRTYILYVAIAMIGFSFIAFMILDRSAMSYIIVDTLMLGACGVYDLFWWSILGEMLEFDKNPAKILGVGLSANVMGVLIGGLIGNVIEQTGSKSINSSVIALVVVFITLIILPVLHKHLLMLLKNHAYLTVLSEIPSIEEKEVSEEIVILNQLTERESEIASLLLKGRTYKMVAQELYLSENTVKTHIKNIYSKFNIQSKAELVKLLVEKYPSTFN